MKRLDIPNSRRNRTITLNRIILQKKERKTMCNLQRENICWLPHKGDMDAHTTMNRTTIQTNKYSICNSCPGWIPCGAIKTDFVFLLVSYLAQDIVLLGWVNIRLGHFEQFCCFLLDYLRTARKSCVSMLSNEGNETLCMSLTLCVRYSNKRVVRDLEEYALA